MRGGNVVNRFDNKSSSTGKKGKKRERTTQLGVVRLVNVTLAFGRVGHCRNCSSHECDHLCRELLLPRPD